MADDNTSDEITEESDAAARDTSGPAEAGDGSDDCDGNGETGAADGAAGTEATDGLIASGELPPEVVAALLAERARGDAAEERMMRAVAEADNQRKRIEREYAERARYANEGVLSELLGVFDTLELAIAQSVPAAGAEDRAVGELHKGVELALQQFLSALESTGVTPVEAAVGDSFDPKVHEALLRDDESELPAQHIARVMQRGFRYHERILRPARVIVSTGKGQGKAE